MPARAEALDSLMIILLMLIVTGGLAAMTAISLLNWLALPVLRKTDAHTFSRVSVLIPARNEASKIAGTIRDLLRQTHPHFELLVLDDQSEDGTALAVQECAAGDRRLRVLQGSPPPPGWLGKAWACQQLAAQANEELLIFCDADVGWHETAINVLLCEMDRRGADLLAVFPTQRTETWSERLCVPLIAYAIHAYLPVYGVHHLPFPQLAAANGQCIAFRRQAYNQVGGHAVVRDNVLEDVGLARLTKRAGLRLRMAEAGGLVTCRMYCDWQSVREGFAKNILAGFGGPPGLMAATTFHWLTFLAPWVFLVSGFAGAGVPGHLWWPTLLIFAGISVRGFSAWRSGQRVTDALWLPASVLVMTCIAGQALWWQLRYGGPLWKGRRAVA